MVDTIKCRLDFGYASLPPSHQLQYADDTCLIADSPASCQQLLHVVDRWLKWSGMKAKVPKCHSLALQASTGRVVNPHLFIASEPVRFLGMRIEVPHDIAKTKQDLVTNLQRRLDLVNCCPLTRRQKLKLYRAGVCPRLSWLLTIEELPISWLEKHLDSIATKYITQWAGLAKSANTALLYLPQKKGDLNIPLISGLHKCLQVYCQSQLLTSPDPCVRLMAEKGLQKDLTLQ